MYPLIIKIYFYTHTHPHIHNPVVKCHHFTHSILHLSPFLDGTFDQCICAAVIDPDTDEVAYPISYEWVERLVYIGREELFVEYIEVTEVLDHWIYGPHHLWSYPESGQVLRMWQPFNGLQIYPTGVSEYNRSFLFFIDFCFLLLNPSNGKIFGNANLVLKNGGQKQAGLQARI